MTQLSEAMLASEWDFASASMLTAALYSGKLSACELLEHTIRRIEALDAFINAVIVRDFDVARTAAKAADAAIARSERRPLLGIPVTLKEPFNVAGLPTTWGDPTFKDFVPTQDALVVSRLKEAGAVVIGKTNIPLGLRDFQSYNAIHGMTKNPWDFGRTPGGSSGGSAASLASGFEVLSIGSDIGGSVRAPAHFCGVCAHKPSLGLVPLRGYNPPSAPPLPGHGDLAVAGPLARHVSDLALALDVVAGPDEDYEGTGYCAALPGPRHTRLEDYRVFVIDTHPLIPTSAVVRSAVGRLAEQMERSGAKVGWASPALPDLAGAARLYMKLLNAAKSPSAGRDDLMDAERLVHTPSSDDYRLQIERARGTLMSHRDWLAADGTRRQLQQQWHAFFRDWDVVIYPAAAVPAFPHDHSEPIEARHLDIDGKSYSYYDTCFVWADPASTCGLPATSIPIERSPEGLPIGVQIIGPYLEDRTAIAFAALVGRRLGGFVPPPFAVGANI
jgi:amidase